MFPFFYRPSHSRMSKGGVCTDSRRFFFPFAVLAFSSPVQGQSASSMPALVVAPFLLGPMGPPPPPREGQGRQRCVSAAVFSTPITASPPPSDHILCTSTLQNNRKIIMAVKKKIGGLSAAAYHFLNRLREDAIFIYIAVLPS